MKYHESIKAIKEAQELDALGEDGQLWLAAKYTAWDLEEMYDHHNGGKEQQKYIAQTKIIQLHLEKAGK
jgi:hypothetical protein